jgi:dTDP-4-dehydrorhamnose reductase
MDISRRYGRIKTSRIEPIKTADYPTKAMRPAYSTLDCGLIGKHFGICPKPWQNSLAITIQELCSSPAGFLAL